MKKRTAFFLGVAALITGLSLYIFQKISSDYQYDDEMNDVHGNFGPVDFEEYYGIEHLK